jgi:hypothetical protein
VEREETAARKRYLIKYMLDEGNKYEQEDISNYDFDDVGGCNL